MAQVRPPGYALNWLLRHACIAAVGLGLVANARDPDRRTQGLLASLLGTLGLFTWAIVRIIARLFAVL